MPLPILNRDKFATGGVMDSPDLAVRTAALKAQAGQQLTAQEFRRLATRQQLEQENARPSTSASTSALRAANPGGVDVRSYTGSMFTGTAQPAAAAASPVPGAMVPNPAATNFGRLSTPRTDVPAMVPADRVPQGVSPLALGPVGNNRGSIDVREYGGSRYAGNSDPKGITPASGLVDVRDYSGSRYAPGAAAQFMGSSGDSVAGGYDPRSAASLFRGTRMDPAETDIRREMQGAEFRNTEARTAATMSGVSREGRNKDAWDRAMAGTAPAAAAPAAPAAPAPGAGTSSSPSVAAAEAIRGGGGTVPAQPGAQPGAAAPASNVPPAMRRRVDAYIEAGGDDPAHINALSRLDKEPKPEPALRDFGTDAYGRRVQGLVDAQGNVSRIADPKETEPKQSPLALLMRERDDARKAGRTDLVADYDRVIQSYGAKVDAFGNVIGAAPQPSIPGALALPATAPGAKASAAAPTKGQRVKQQGVTYEFDGKNWQPVK